MVDFDKDAGHGFDNMHGQDLAVPFLYICQSNSPQLIETRKEYIEGIRPGHIYNTQTLKYWKEIHVIVVRYQFKYVEWKADRQGFAASYSRGEEPTDYTVDQLTGRRVRPNGNALVDTMHFLVLVKEDNWERAILPMSSTQLKYGRSWNTQMAGYRTPKGNQMSLYSHYFKLTTTPEQNKKGTWFGWTVRVDGEVQDQGLYDHARETYLKMENFLPERIIAQLSNGGDKDVM